jgi:protein transport protein HofC
MSKESFIDAQDSQQPSPARRLRGFGLRHMMFVIVLCALAAAAVRQFQWGLLLILLLLVPPFLLVGLFVLFSSRKATQQDSLLRVMAIATERRMPLAPGIGAFAELCHGGYRRKSLGLAYLLESGVPLPQALASIPGILPQAAIVLACVGWNDGALGVALREAVAANEVRRAYRYALLPKIGYLCGTLFFLQIVVGFILYFISPKFEAIFADFGIALPETTLFTFRAGHFLLGSGAIAIPVLLEIAVFLYLPFAYFGWVNWEFPFVDQVFRRRDSAAILRSLAIGVDAGQPMSSSVGLLAGFYPKAWMRRRLQRVHDDLAAGGLWFESLWHRGVVRKADAVLLESAQRAGNLPWALRALADSNERSLGYRLQAWSQFLFPVIVIAVGSVVALVALAYFVPLINLIQSLAG